MLRCDCGAPVRITDATDSGNGDYTEQYECEDCGRSGTLTVRNHSIDTLTGCLTTVTPEVL